MGCPSSGQLRIIAPLSPVASMAQGYRAVRGILIFDMAFVAVVMVPSEPSQRSPLTVCMPVRFYPSAYRVGGARLPQATVTASLPADARTITK
jgi:hypothetical protein